MDEKGAKGTFKGWAWGGVTVLVRGGSVLRGACLLAVPRSVQSKKRLSF